MEFLNYDDAKVIMTSRIRIARNIDGYSYPGTMKLEAADSVTEEVLQVMSEIEDKYEFHRLRDLPYPERLFYNEEHLISPRLIKNSDFSSFFLSEDKKITIMVNEEDHLRIQSIDNGLRLREIYNKVNAIDDFLDKRLNLAYDEKLGYLTSCPTNTGTGLRASVMLHIPALNYFGIENISRSLVRLGYTLRGINGEGTKAEGAIYQISNEKTIGESELTYISNLEKITVEIATMENSKRKELYLENLNDLDDMVNRSFGLLRYARKLSYEEAVHNLSNIKLGLDLSVIKAKKPINIFNLIFKVQNVTLQKERGSILDEKSREIYRANKIRNIMKEVF